MKYLKPLIIIIIAITINSCNKNKVQEKEEEKSKNSFPIEDKEFLLSKIDSTSIFHYIPGDTIHDDLSNEEKKKYILTKDAAHKYKLISVQKKSENYIGIIILYIMEGGNKQFYVTVDKTGKAISDLLIQSNHRDGPIQLENGDILMFSKVNSYFNEDTITVVERRVMAKDFSMHAKKWELTKKDKYIVANNGKFKSLEY